MKFEPGKIQTYVGTGEKGYAGDGGPADQALCTEPFMCDFDSAGNLFYSESRNNVIRRVDKATGIVTTVAGNGESGYSGDGGPALASTWNGPKAIRCDHQDNILVVDTENHAIRRIDGVTGVVTTVAGGHLGADGDGGDPTAAGLDRPHGVGVDRAGNLFIADSKNNRVRVVGLG